MLLNDDDPHDLGRVGKAMLLAERGGDIASVANRLYANGRHRHVAQLLHRAAVEGAGVASGDWGSELSDIARPSIAHAELSRSLSVLSRLAVRSVAFNVPLTWLTTGTRGVFVGERAAIPAVKMTFAPDARLGPRKIATLAASSRELLDAPGSEETLSRELAGGIAEGIDTHLLDPDLHETEARPASVTSLATTVYDGSGVNTVAEIDGLLGAMVQRLVALGSPITGAVRWITSLTNLAGLATLRDPQGGLAFPTVRAAQDGGSVAGIPVIGTQFGPQDQLVLLDGSEVVVADENLTRIAVSEVAAIEQDDAPQGGSATLVSMFTSDSLALKAVRWINWTMRNPRVVLCRTFAVAPSAPPELT